MLIFEKSHIYQKTPRKWH